MNRQDAKMKTAEQFLLSRMVADWGRFGGLSSVLDQKQPKSAFDLSKCVANWVKSFLDNVKSGLEITKSDFQIPLSRSDIANSNLEIANSNSDIPLSNLEITNSNLEITNSNLEITNSNSDIPLSNLEITNSNSDIPLSNLEITNSHSNIVRKMVKNRHLEINCSKTGQSSRFMFYAGRLINQQDNKARR